MFFCATDKKSEVFDKPEEFNIPDWASEIKNSCSYIVRIDADFIVFLDKRLEIDWITSNSFDETIKTKPKGWELINSISSHIRLVYIELPDYTSKERKKHISMHLGEALVAGLHENDNLAKEIILAVKATAAEAATQDIRKQVLTACMICVVFSLLGIAIARLNNYYHFNDIINAHKVYLLSFFIASLGSVVSIFLKSTQIANDKKINDQSALRLEVYFKILSGAIFGCIAIELSKAGMLPIEKTNQSALYIFAFISGFAERFIPDVLSKQTPSTPE